MPSNAQLIEERVLQAYNAYERDEYSNIKAAAEVFDAPYQRVRRRLQGLPGAPTRGGHNKRLSVKQESALYTLIKRYNDLGLSTREQALEALNRQVAIKILRNFSAESAAEGVGDDDRATTTSQKWL
ncbi:hypothetical protein A1O3_01296 [Capronia epimyces CBS 606.96]|uniref:HTH psq-type domain-containing protein n=1 Tax=Capronia epimyces CBS 606.96 TaxID=1182542 RepID=W9ZDY9_9EURO|nr:uncharacterized protein A1O3_01296 [Capronia epimyces CBS 606.96]EXJ92744.1 hypothetical protein A1O3_01296 [Capronia epimyces CBS 606.96]